MIAAKMGPTGPAGAALPEDREPPNCEFESPPKREEMLTLVLAALFAWDLAEGAPLKSCRSSAAKKEPHRPSNASSAAAETPAPNRGFFAAGSQAVCESEADLINEDARSKEDGCNCEKGSDRTDVAERDDCVRESMDRISCESSSASKSADAPCEFSPRVSFPLFSARSSLPARGASSPAAPTAGS